MFNFCKVINDLGVNGQHIRYETRDERDKRDLQLTFFLPSKVEAGVRQGITIQFDATSFIMP